MQLKEAGIENIYVITGYKAEQLQYLKEKFNIELIHNPDYLTRNNNASIRAARHVLKNSYVFSCNLSTYVIILKKIYRKMCICFQQPTIETETYFPLRTLTTK